MAIRIPILILILTFILSCAGQHKKSPLPEKSAQYQTLNEHLEIFRPYVGKTWIAEGVDENGNAYQDVSKWERALNGEAVKSVHSLNEGLYGGENIIIWDAEKNALVSYYFTTGGFYTIGTLTVDGDKIYAHETVHGEAGGISEVRATITLIDENTMHSSSEYLREGEWVTGMEFTYKADPSGNVILK